MKYNLLKLHNELVNAGLPVVGVDSNGSISWSASPTTTQKQLAKSIITAHDPTETPKPDPIQELKTEMQEIKTALIENNIIEGDVKP